MITILFSCDVCGLVDAECKVRAREKGEDVAHYVQNVIGREVAYQHQLQSFTCPATSFQNLKIPIDKNDPDCWIGKQTDILPPKEKKEPKL